MKLYIPNLGDDLVLSQDWTFKLYAEGRNNSLWVDVFDGYNSKEYGEYQKQTQNQIRTLVQEYREKGTTESWQAYTNATSGRVFSMDCTIPATSTLRVDRIYIRKGQDDFSSVTFYLVNTPSKILKPGKRMPRFWAKLDDVNTMEIV